jgi:hypothetical protein
VSQAQRTTGRRVMSNELIMLNPLELAVMYEHDKLQIGKLATGQSQSRPQLYILDTQPGRNLLRRASTPEQFSWGIVVAVAQYQEGLDIVRGFAS